MRRLYSHRAADYHEIATEGKSHDERAVEHYLRLVREHGEGGGYFRLTAAQG